MGDSFLTKETYTAALASVGVTRGSKGVTKKAEQQAKKTGKLQPIVDPAEFGVTRLSLPRVGKEDGGWKLLVGTPIPIETRFDSTSSMGDSVDTALEVLPNAFEYWKEVLEDYDIQASTGIFGDVVDDFVLCRPPFEMVADKIVNQLTQMVPERGGGDPAEDPDVGIFGGAYLVRSYINRIGLKRYDFTVTDAPGRGRVDDKTLKRTFGDEVFTKVSENGHQIKHNGGSMELETIWNDLLEEAHAFIIVVRNSSSAKRFWNEHCGKERVVPIPHAKWIPQTQAAIIGLTEGVIEPQEVVTFLTRMNVDEAAAETIMEALVDIPLGAQAQLPNFDRRPMKGDFFAEKPDVWEDTNIWPISSSSVEEAEEDGEDEDDDEERDTWI